jgi:hypothetical protein
VAITSLPPLGAYGALIVAAVAAVAAGVSCSFKTPDRAHDDAADRAQILRLYEATRQAHLRRDPVGFVAADADTIINISDGAVQVVSRDSAIAHLRRYVADRAFTEATDIEPPQIQVSSDGKFAWLIGHVMVRGTRTRPDSGPAPFAFRAAWVDLWRKTSGEWRIVAHANTERDTTVDR